MHCHTSSGSCLLLCKSFLEQADVVGLIIMQSAQCIVTHKASRLQTTPVQASQGLRHLILRCTRRKAQVGVQRALTKVRPSDQDKGGASHPPIGRSTLLCQGGRCTGATPKLEDDSTGPTRHCRYDVKAQSGLGNGEGDLSFPRLNCLLGLKATHRSKVQESDVLCYCTDCGDIMPCRGCYALSLCPY